MSGNPNTTIRSTKTRNILCRAKRARYGSCHPTFREILFLALEVIFVFVLTLPNSYRHMLYAKRPPHLPLLSDSPFLFSLKGWQDRDSEQGGRREASL